MAAPASSSTAQRQQAYVGSHALRAIDYFYVVAPLAVRDDEEGAANEVRRSTAARKQQQQQQPPSSNPPNPPPPPAPVSSSSPSSRPPGSSFHSPLCWEVRVVERYPDASHPWQSVPHDMKVEALAFPHGFQLETEASLRAKPSGTDTAALVTTGANGAYTYLVGLTHYVALTEDECAAAGLPSAQFFKPVCWIVSSSWPFWTQMHRFLATLYRDMFELQGAGFRIPKERVIENLIAECRLPPVAIGLQLNQAAQWTAAVVAQPFMHVAHAAAVAAAPASQKQQQQPQLLSGVSERKKLTCPWSSLERDVRWDGSSLVFSVPPPLELPLRDFSLGRLFQFLSVSDVLTCFAAMLLEKRILFVSHAVWKLTLAIETLSYLLLPFYPCAKTIHFLPPELKLDVRDLMEGPGPSMLCGISHSQWSEMQAATAALVQYTQPQQMHAAAPGAGGNNSSGSGAGGAASPLSPPPPSLAQLSVPHESMVVLLDGPSAPGQPSILKHDEFVLPELPMKSDMIVKLTAVLKKHQEQQQMAAKTMASPVSASAASPTSSQGGGGGGSAGSSGPVTRSSDDDFSSVFLGFFSVLLHQYRSYLLPLSSNPSVRRNRVSGFDDLSFLRAHSLKTSTFLQELLYNTQGFQQFISARVDSARVQPNLQSTFPAVQLEILTFDHLMQMHQPASAPKKHDGLTYQTSIGASLTTWQVPAPTPAAAPAGGDTPKTGTPPVPLFGSSPGSANAASSSSSSTSGQAALFSYSVHRPCHPFLSPDHLSSPKLREALAWESSWMAAWTTERAAAAAQAANSSSATLPGATAATASSADGGGSKSHVSFFVRQSDFGVALTLLRFKSTQLGTLFLRFAEYYLCKHESEARQLEEARLLQALHRVRCSGGQGERHLAVESAESSLVEPWRQLCRYEQNELGLLDHMLAENESLRATLLAMLAQSADIELIFKELTAIDGETVRSRARSEQALRKYFEASLEFQTAVGQAARENGLQLAAGAGASAAPDSAAGTAAAGAVSESPLPSGPVLDSLIQSSAASLTSHRVACHDLFCTYALCVADFDIQCDFFERLFPASIDQLRQLMVERSLMLKRTMGSTVAHEIELIDIKRALLKGLQESIESVSRKEEEELLQQQRTVEFWATSRAGYGQGAQMQDRASMQRSSPLSPSSSLSLSASARSSPSPQTFHPSHARSPSSGRFGTHLAARSPISVAPSQLVASTRVTPTTSVEIEDMDYWDSLSRTRERSTNSFVRRGTTMNASPAGNNAMTGRAEFDRRFNRSPAAPMEASTATSQHNASGEESNGLVEDSAAATASTSSSSPPAESLSYALSLWCSAGDHPNFQFVHGRLHGANALVADLLSTLNSVIGLTKHCMQAGAKFLEDTQAITTRATAASAKSPSAIGAANGAASVPGALFLPSSLAFFHSLHMCHSNWHGAYESLCRGAQSLSLLCQVMHDSTERIEAQLASTRVSTDQEYRTKHARATAAAAKQEEQLRAARLKAVLTSVTAVGSALMDAQKGRSQLIHGRVKEMATALKTTADMPSSPPSRLVAQALQITRDSPTTSIAGVAAIASLNVATPGDDSNSGSQERLPSPTSAVSYAGTPTLMRSQGPSPAPFASQSPHLGMTTNGAAAAAAAGGDAPLNPSTLLVVGDHAYNPRAPTKETQVYQLRLCNLLQLYENNEVECLQLVTECMRRLSAYLSSFRQTRQEQIQQLFLITEALALEQEVMGVLDHAAHAGAVEGSSTVAPPVGRAGAAGVMHASATSVDVASFTTLSFAVDPDSDHPRPSNLMTPLMHCVEEQMALLDLALRWAQLQAQAYEEEVAVLTQMQAVCARACSRTASSTAGSSMSASWRAWYRCLETSGGWLGESVRLRSELQSLVERLRKQLSMHRSFFAKWCADCQQVDKQLSLVTTTYVAALLREQKAQVAYDACRPSSGSRSKQEALQRTLESARVASIQEKQVLRDACVHRNRELQYLLKQFDSEHQRVWAARFHLVRTVQQASVEESAFTNRWKEWKQNLQAASVMDDMRRAIRRCRRGASRTSSTWEGSAAAAAAAAAAAGGSASSPTLSLSPLAAATAASPAAASPEAASLPSVEAVSAPLHVLNKQCAFSLYKANSPLLAETDATSSSAQ